MKQKIYLLAVMAMCLLMITPTRAQKLDLEWATQFLGSTDSTKGIVMTSGITLDKEENVYAVGGFRDSVKFNTLSGRVALASPNGTGMFLAKLTTDGAVVWVKSVIGKKTMATGGGGDNGQASWFSITSDEEDNLYITGNYADSVDFDPSSSSTANRTTASVVKTSPPTCLTCPATIDTIFDRNGFILKLDKEGNFKWVRTIPGNGNSTTGIAYDTKEGTIVFTGYFRDTSYFGGTILTTPENTPHTFVAKYDTAGNFHWVKQMGKTVYQKGISAVDEGIDIYVDKNSNIYTTGVFSDSADYDPGPGTAYLRSLAGTAENVFISKLDPKGDYVWAKAIGSVSTSSPSRPFGITVDDRGNVITVGFFQVAAMLDPENTAAGAFPATNFYSGFISKLDSNGKYVWGRVFDRPMSGGKPVRSGIDYGLGVQVDTQGSIFIGGRFFGDVYLNPNPTDPNREIFKSGGPSNDGFILKLFENGDFAWARHFVRTDTPVAPAKSYGYNLNKCIKLAPSGNLYVGGYMHGTIDFNPSGTPYKLTSEGVREGDGFVAKLSCQDTSSAQVAIEECADTYDFLGETFQEGGEYVRVIPNQSGCDSTIYLHLILNPVPHAVINVDGFILSTATPYNTYQWILNDTLIQGATDSTYEVKQNGYYRVIVSTDAGCIDTSDVYLVENYTGIYEAVAMADEIDIYPNPTTEKVYIKSPVKVNVSLNSMVGQAILQVSDARVISLQGLSAGAYLLHVTDVDGNLIKVEKIVKR